MTETERVVLNRLLSVDFEGVEALRRQAEHVVGVESSCTCGCPSVSPRVDKDAADGAVGPSPLPPEVLELKRSDGIPRTVLCFRDAEGYLTELECVYYDDAKAEWPAVEDCAVLVRDDDHYVAHVTLPNGAQVQPQEPDDRWVSFEPRESGFAATTWTGFRETFGADGSLTSRIFTK